MKRQALGRGLSALLSEEYRDSPDIVSELEVDALAPNGRQPRAFFDQAALDSLAKSRSCLTVIMVTGNDVYRGTPTRAFESLPSPGTN